MTPEYVTILQSGCVVSERGGPSRVVESMEWDEREFKLRFQVEGKAHAIAPHALPLTREEDRGFSDGEKWTFYLPEDAMDWELDELVLALAHVRNSRPKK